MDKFKLQAYITIIITFGLWVYLFMSDDILTNHIGFKMFIMFVLSCVCGSAGDTLFDYELRSEK